MNETLRLKYLRVALLVFGAIASFAFYPLTLLWPSGWIWHDTGTSHDLTMLIGIYATFGIFLMLAAKDPLQHRSLIWFAVWSSLVHGGSWPCRRSPILNISAIFMVTCWHCSLPPASWDS